MSRKEEKPSVFVSLFMGVERNGWPSPPLMEFSMHLARLQERGRRIHVQPVIGAIPHDHARNHAVQMFLNTDHEWLLMIDNDMCPDRQTLALIDTAPDVADIVVPRMFGMVNTPAGKQLALCWEPKPGTPFHSGEWVEINGSGSGVMGIRRRAFSAMQPPYFKFEYDELGMVTCGEDNHFSHKAHAAGLRFFGSNRVEVGHMHSVDYSLMARLCSAAGTYDMEQIAHAPTPQQHLVI